MASSLVAALLAITFILICLHIFRLSIVNKKDPVRSSRKGKKPRKLLISLGSGGHTSEMLQMLRTMDLTPFDTRIYYISSGDVLSHQKATSFEKSLKKESEDGSYRIRTLSRARRVKQSWWSTPLTATTSFLDALRFTYVDQPDLFLCNGPGTCVMIVVSILVLKYTHVKHCRVIFVESFARVNSLSLSGKLLYHLVDRFLVMWPDLVEKYPKAEYAGLLI